MRATAIVSFFVWGLLALGAPAGAGAEVAASPEEVLTPSEVKAETWGQELPEAVEDGWVRGQTPAAATPGAAPAAVIPESERAASKMPYNGGNVQVGEIHAYVIFWGSKWNQDPAGKEHVLEMYRYINGSPWTGILTQYFNKTGEHPSGQVALTSYTDTTGTESPQSITVASIEAEVKKSIQTQGWPTGFNNTYVVLPAVGSTEGTGFNATCAKHSFDTELGVPWTYTAYPTGEATECIGSSEGVLLQPWQQEQTDAAFEFAQAATDPQTYNKFGGNPPAGWVRPAQPEQISSETGKDNSFDIGEECATAGQVEAAPSIWLPRIEDNYLLAETGMKCVAQDKEPVRFTLSPGAAQFPAPQHATVTATVIPGGWAARYRFHVTDAAIGYSATVPAEFKAVANTKKGEVVSAELPAVKGGQAYSVTLEGYNALTEADPPITSSTTVETASGSFTTPAWTPEVTPGTPAAESFGQEKLNATVNPRGTPTTYHFEYGPTTAYGSRVPANASEDHSAGPGNSPVPVSTSASALRAETTYHYRVAATNSEGTTYGADSTFTSPAYAPQSVGTWGSFGVEEGRFDRPIGVASLTVLGTYEVLFVTDSLNDRIEEFGGTSEDSGAYFRSFGTPGTGPGQFNEPTGIAVGPIGEESTMIWVADTGNHRVEAWEDHTAFEGEGFHYRFQVGAAVEGHPALAEPVGVAAVGNAVWVIDHKRDRLVEYSQSGSVLHEVGSAGTGTCQFTSPGAVAVDPAGHVWVADTGNNRLEEFSPTGTYMATIGTKGSGSGQLSEPSGISFEPSGNLLITDKGNDRVVELTPKGEQIASFGSKGSGATQLLEPRGIYIGAYKEIYVVDSGDNRVSRWAQATRPEIPELVSSGYKPATGTFVLGANIRPDGLATSYVIQWGPSEENLSYSTSSASAGSGYTPVSVKTTVPWAQSSSGFYRVIATNSEGTTTSSTVQFNVGIHQCNHGIC